MRGRRLLREPCSPSLCAFCAHRFGAARQPSHVQRRFLQSSRSASTPPAAGTALKGDDRIDRTSHQRGPEVPSWGQPGPQTSGLAGGWGRSTIGNGIPSPGPAGSWGRLGGGGIPSAGGNTEVDRSSYTPRPVELTPDEQRARDLIMERQKRHVDIHGGPGPESSRSGRPVPTTKHQKFDQKLSAAREALNRREMAQKRHMENGGTGFKIRRHMIGDFDSGDKALSNTLGDNAWTGLKKREAVSPQQESPRDDFAEARLQREKESQTGRYIPLRNRPISESRYNPGDANRFRINRLPISNMDSHRITKQGSQGISDRGILQPNSETTYPFQASGGEPAFVDGSRRVQLNESAEDGYQQAESSTIEDGYRPAMQEEPAVQKYEPAYTRQPKLSSRFTANVEYNEMPKGRGRDKARRRQQFVEDEDGGDDYDKRAKQKEIKKQRKLEKAAKKADAPIPVLLPEYISVSNLAIALRVRFEDFVAKMEELGFEETSHDHVLNSENAGLIAMEYNFDPIIDRGESEDLVARPPAEDQSLLPQRPPVVTIMGHVDHGKTTLLDWLRKSSVAASEHGGITQHIGAFSVPMPGGKIITFLDTPGHAAFLSMRQRGANVTDIVILVVAADDSVKPQTIEAINHAKAAKVPVIVAINKIDKEDSNIDRVKQDLARHGVEIEDFGGDTQVVCVSGKTGQGMEKLEEAAVTLSEILDMRAEQDGQAEGWVLEASIKAVGKVATVLVRRGTMRPGDFIVAGKTWARIRCLRNEAGVLVDQAGPGTPVEIDGWKEQPLAGDEVLQAPDEQKAKSVVEYRLEREERDKMAEDMEAINEIRKEVEEAREREKQDALTGDDEAATSASTTPETTVGGPKQVYFIVKGDVSGSVEAVIDSINTVGNGEVQPHILRSGVGQINEFDIEHAAAAKGHVINFNTLVDENISAMAKASKVTIIDNNIIYRLIDDVKAKLSEHLAPLITQKVLGEAEIAQIFEITVKGRTTKAIAGCKVRNGVVGKNAKVRVLRGGEKVFEGHLASLKNQKKDVMEMRKGTECGIGFDNWFEFQVGDQVQSFEEREEKRYL